MTPAKKNHSRLGQWNANLSRALEGAWNKAFPIGIGMSANMINQNIIRKMPCTTHLHYWMMFVKYRELTFSCWLTGFSNSTCVHESSKVRLKHYAYNMILLFQCMITHIAVRSTPNFKCVFWEHCSLPMSSIFFSDLHVGGTSNLAVHLKEFTA